MRGAPVALRQPVFSRLTPRCHVRVASPIPVTAGPPRSQQLRGGFSGALRLKNRRIQFEAGLAPRALLLLCGCSLVWNTERGKSFIRRIAPEKPHDLIRGGSCTSGTPAALWMFPCVEYGARQKKRPPRSQRLRGGCCYFIRRGTAAGTRAGCSSPPRTAKRRRRERACPCRSR